MESGNAKFDSLLVLIKEANENNIKIKYKINLQIEEINKTKAIINQFEECLKLQNEMLNKLLIEKLAIKNHKNDLVKEMRKLENSDDEGFERNVYDNQDKDVDLVQRKSGNKISRQIDNNVQIINNNTDEVMNDNLKQFFNDDEPIEMNVESFSTNGNLLNQSSNNQLIENNDQFIPVQEKISKGNVLLLNENWKIPNNKVKMFKDEEFISKHSPKLMLKLKDDTVVYMSNFGNYLIVCCAKGFLLRYNKMTKLWSKFDIGNSKNISQYLKFKNKHYLVCENEFVIFNKSKTLVKAFNSNIISNLCKPLKKHPFCHVSLENGEIWKYNIINDECSKILSFHGKMKTCLNLPTSVSLFLTEDRKVFIAQNKIKAIPKLNGCVDIIASNEKVAVCYFRNGVCKIYEMGNRKMCELKIPESIKLARHSKSVLSVLDVQNRLHLFKLEKKTFTYNKFRMIQIPIKKDISAMSDVSNEQVFIIVENKIYLIEIK